MDKNTFYLVQSSWIIHLYQNQRVIPSITGILAKVAMLLYIHICIYLYYLYIKASESLDPW